MTDAGDINLLHIFLMLIVLSNIFVLCLVGFLAYIWMSFDLDDDIPVEDLLNNSEMNPYSNVNQAGNGPSSNKHKDICLKSLSCTGEPYLTLERVIIRKDIMKTIRYCCNTKCSMPFDWINNETTTEDVVLPENQVRIRCLFCKEETCARCRSKWHFNLSCAQFMDLNRSSPLFNRSGKISRQCPDCGHLIDKRPGDCNFVVCLCGCAFCYNCGTAYKSLNPIATNEHGEPEYCCGLFEEEERSTEAENSTEAELPGTNGVNGYVNLLMCLNGGPPRSRLPKSMIEAIGLHTCPYTECKKSFTDLKALELHLAFVRRHVVYLCCGRPFSTYSDLHRHEDNNCPENRA